MTWIITADVDEFLTEAGAFLGARPAENTVPLTVADSLRIRGRHAYGDADPVFGWWLGDSGAVTGAFLRTPPYPLLLAQCPAGAVPSLAETLVAVDPSLSGINADLDDATSFAAEWARLTGVRAEVRRRSRLHRLGELVPPDPPVPGKARVADGADLDLIVTWFEEFGREVGEPGTNTADAVTDRLRYGGVTLWEVEGTAVSLAGRMRPSAGVVRIGPVYTPPALRGRGYAGAATAAVSRAALDAGADEVVLYTDLANPTSNRLYARLGYRAVQDSVILSFT